MGIALTLLPLLIGPIITITVIVFVLSAKRRVARGEPVLHAPTKQTVRIWAVLAALGFSLFVGFVGAAVIGAVFPKSVMFAADMACAGTVSHDSFDYSYKPGQHGTSQEFECLVPGQEPQRIVGKTFLFAGLTFSGGAFVVMLIALAMLGNLVHRFFGGRFSGGSDTQNPSGPTTGGNLGSVIDGFLANARTRGQSDGSTTVLVNGKQVNLAPSEAGALYRSISATVAAAGGAQPQGGQPVNDERSIAERLQEVEELYRSGAINRDEYEVARERVLGEI